MILKSLQTEILHSMQALAEEGLQRLEKAAFDLLTTTLGLKCGLCSGHWQRATIDFGAEAILILFGDEPLFAVWPAEAENPKGTWNVVDMVDLTISPVLASGPSRVEAAQACVDQIDSIPLPIPSVEAMAARMIREGVTLH